MTWKNIIAEELCEGPWLALIIAPILSFALFALLFGPDAALLLLKDLGVF